jgi:hypothetical protein
MPDSTLPAAGDEGTVNKQKMRKLEMEWGRLPRSERERLLTELTRSMSPSQRETVENYFRRLNESR